MERPNRTTLLAAVVIGCWCVVTVSGIESPPNRYPHKPTAMFQENPMHVSKCDPDRKMNELFDERTAREKLTGQDWVEASMNHFRLRRHYAFACGSDNVMKKLAETHKMNNQQRRNEMKKERKSGLETVLGTAPGNRYLKINN